ncbi:MAG: hypothetical protein ACFFDW_06185 [Candidatus Thorarchaeota archaeon]
MADFPTDLVISAVISGLFFILFGLLVYQSIKKNRTAYILTISLFLGGIGGIISVLQNIVSIGSKYFLYTSLIVWSIVYFLIYIFFEQLFASKPDRIRLSIASVLLFASIFFDILYLFAPTASFLELTGDLQLRYETFLNIMQWGWDTSYNLLGLLIFIFGAYVHFKSFQFTREKVTIVQAISMCIIGSGFIVGYVGGDIFKNSDFFGIGDGIKIVGMLLFAFIYVIRIDFIYRLPVNVYFILVFTKFGLNIHISRVHDTSVNAKIEDYNEEKLINENLLSSLITAISGLLNESLGSEKELKSIVAEDRTLVMDSGEYATCAVLCDRPTFFLEKSLMNLIKSIEQNYGEKLSKSAIIKEDFKGVDNLIRKIFPFLIIEKAKINLE